MPIFLVLVEGGVLSSVAVKVIVWYPVWLALGFQEKTPVDGSNVAPAGN